MDFSRRGFGKALAVALVVALVFVAGVLTDRYFVGSSGLAKSEGIPEFGGVEGASYIIFKEDSTYYAKNGRTGTIDYSGTNAGQIIQNCIDAMPDDGLGGLIYFKEGQYTLQSTVNLNKWSITICGNGRGSQINTLDNIVMFNVSNHGYLTFKNVGIRHHGTSGAVIHAPIGVEHARIENVYIENQQGEDAFRGTIFNFSGGGALNYEVHITDCSINFGKYLLYYKGSELTITATKFGAAKEDGPSYVYITGSGHVNIQGCGFECTTLHLEDCLCTNMVGNWWTKPPDGGIYLYQIRNSTITNNIIYNIQRFDEGTLFGIHMYGESKPCSNNIVSNNVIYITDDDSIGIWEGSNCLNNEFVGNNLVGCIGTKMLIEGTNSIVKFNQGYITENSGTAIFNNNNTVTFNHKLAGTPTGVWVSFNVTGWGDWRWNATSTQLTVTTSNNINATCYWHTQYQP